MDELWQTKKAPIWLILAVVIAHIASSPFFNFVFFPNHWHTPLSHATGGLINGTLQANLLILVFVIVGLIFLAGGQRPSDVGWRASKLPAAIVSTLILWAFVNLLAVAVAEAKGIPLAFNEAWTKPGTTKTIGTFIAQIFGNALCEETIFRGFLTVQVMLLLRSFGKATAVVAAVILVQAFFASIHIPMLLTNGASWTDILETLPVLFLAGTMLAIIYLVTGNLFVGVGVHALTDAYMLIPGDPLHLSDNFGLVYLGAGFVGVLLWRLAWPRVRLAPAAET